MAPNDFRDASRGPTGDEIGAPSQHRHVSAQLGFRQSYQRNTLATEATRPGRSSPVTRRNRTALLAALVALMASAPLAAANGETPPDNKASTKTPARPAEKKSAEKKNRDKKTEK